MISPELLAGLSERMDAGLCAWQLEDPADDRSLRLVAGNPAAERIMGTRISECLGRRIDDAFPELRALGLPAAYAEVARTGRPWHTDHLLVRDRGVAFSLRAFPLPDRVVGVLFADATRRVRAEEALAEAEARQRALLTALPDTLYVQLPDGTVVDAQSGVPGPAWLGGRLAAIDRGIRTFEAQVDGVDWEVRVIEVGGRRYALVRDISERKRAERSKNELVTIVSHELRTPLTSIHGALGLIDGGVVGAMPQGMRELIGVARANTDRLIRLLDDLLDLDRIEAGVLELHLVAVDADALVDAAIDGVRGAAELAGVRLRRVSLGRHAALADRDRLHQVLTNLLSNALRFSPPQATVTVTIDAPNAGRVRIAVRDEGPGVPPDRVEHLFRRFSQLAGARGKGGTGLGLAISKAIVEGHGGGVGYAREAGVSCFWCELPAAPALPEPVADLFADLRVAYAATLPEQVAGLVALLEPVTGTDEALKLAHKLHGTAGTYGLVAVSEAAGRIEEALRAGDHARIPDALRALRAAVG